MRQKLTSRLGSSPATVRKYLERDRDEVLEERWKAQMTSCPQKQKFIIIQQATNPNIRRRYTPFSSTAKEWYSSFLSSLLFQNSALISISSEQVILSFPFCSSILLRTLIPLSNSPWSSRNLGDSSSTQTDPQSTMKLGSAPQTIISFQLVSAKTGLRKNHPSRTAYNFPIDMQKLIRSMPFPRQAVGLTSANILVVTATVNPKEKPYRKRRNTIASSESARQKIPLTKICKMAPQVISRFRPY